MKYLTSCLVVLLALGTAQAQASPVFGPCMAVEDLTLPLLDRQRESITSPPYIALEPVGALRRLVRRSRPLRREIALTEGQSACLEALTGARLSAVRADASYTYKLQTPTRKVLIFHVANLVGGEALVSARGQRLLAEADRLLKAGRLSEAADAYRAVLQADVPPWEVAVAHASLGKIEKEEGRIESALSQVSQALEAYPQLKTARAEKALLEEEVARLKAARREERRNSLLTQIASLREEGQQQEGIPLAREALELAIKSFGPDSLETAGHLDTLAGLFEAVGNDADAKPLLARALKIREAALGTDHSETVESRDRLASLTRRMSEAEAAKELAKQVTEKPLPAEPEQELEPAGEQEVAAWLEPAPDRTPRAYVDGGTLFSGLEQLWKSITSGSEAGEAEAAASAESGPRGPLGASAIGAELPPGQVGSTMYEPAVLPADGEEGLAKVEIESRPATLEGDRQIESLPAATATSGDAGERGSSGEVGAENSTEARPLR